MAASGDLDAIGDLLPPIHDFRFQGLVGAALQPVSNGGNHQGNPILTSLVDYNDWNALVPSPNGSGPETPSGYQFDAAAYAGL